MIEATQRRVAFKEPVIGFNSITVNADSGDSIEEYDDFVVIVRSNYTLKVPWHNVAGIITGADYLAPAF